MTHVRTPPPLNAPIEWLFIDAGGVLLDDRSLLQVLYQYLADWFVAHGVQVTLAELHATRDRLNQANLDQVYKRVIEHHASDRTMTTAVLHDFRTWLEPRQAALNPPFSGVDDTLTILARQYKLAIAANQGAYFPTLLQGFGLADYFSEWILAGEVGASKPDPRFFEEMLGRSHCLPEQGVMIGDSFANDILPAHRLGLRTIYVQSPDSHPQPSASGEADAVVASFTCVPEILNYWSSQQAPDDRAKS